MPEMKYTALTIGPIYKTLTLARKTRELWGGSYLFSFIMRRLIEIIGENERCCLPYHPKILEESKVRGAGLFPDRLIFEGDIKSKISIAEITILEELAEKTDLPIEYLQNYIRIYSLTYSLPQEISNEINEDEKAAENTNIVIVANKLLDTIELTEKHFTRDINNIDWRKAIDKINGKIFYKEAFAKWEQKRFEFPSIIEIATDDFRKKNKNKYYELVDTHLKQQEESNQLEFQNALRKDGELDESIRQFNPVLFRPYHKYIAVVQADGDNIGKTIGKIGGNATTVRDFSAALFDFAIAAQEKIKNYGGKAVYIGGDDLLFFAPVAVYGEGENGPNLKSIFGLISDLDMVFTDKIINNEKLKHLYEPNGVLNYSKPSMSYGVSITYSKYPLNESKDTAYKLLSEVKDIKPPLLKNRINFKLYKHSGQSYGFMIDKNKTEFQSTNPHKSFDLFLSMVNNIPLQEKLLSSIIYKLAPLQTLLYQISNDLNRLTDFFDQEFELEKLKEKREKHTIKTDEKAKLEFIENIVNYFYLLSKDFPDDNKPLPEIETEQSQSNIAKLYSTLRFMKHLTDEDEE